MKWVLGIRRSRLIRAHPRSCSSRERMGEEGARSFFEVPNPVIMEGKGD